MTSETVGGTPEQVQAETIVAAQTSLLREPQSSDISIKCRGRTWKCQSAILAQRCEFFRVACGGPFEESLTRIINLDDDVPEGVDILLVYLYTLDAPEFDKPAREGAFGRALEAYVIGDKYQTPVLKSVGQKYVLGKLRKYLPGWCVRSTESKDICIKIIRYLWNEGFPPADEIKAVCLEAMMGVAKHIVEEPAFQTLLRENPEFNLEFVRALAQEASSE